MKNEQNHLKKVSIIHTNNIENYKEIKIYPNNKRNTLSKPINFNQNNFIVESYNTINEVNRISKKIYRPKNISNHEIIIDNNTYSRKTNSNNNKYDKIKYKRNSDSQLSSYNRTMINNSNNYPNQIIDFSQNNSTIHVINQSKKKVETNVNNKDINKIYKNLSTTFITGLSAKKPKEKSENKKIGKCININTNKNIQIKNIPKLNLTKLKEISRRNTCNNKTQTSRPLLIKNNLEEIKDTKNQIQNIQNIEKEENKVKFSRRLEITEKTEVLSPNQTFKPFEKFEKKEKPIVEIKKNKDGSKIKVIKEILIITTIESSLINVPEIHLAKNEPKVTLVKHKITKEYITTIKFYSNIIDLNYENSEKKKNNSNHELIEIKSDNQINSKNCEPNINQEKEFKPNINNNEPLIERGTLNGFENNNIYKGTLNEKSRRNSIRNTVYSNVINNNINKPHKKNNNQNTNTNIDNMIRKNIQKKYYRTITNIHRKNKYSVGNGKNGISSNMNINENNARFFLDNNFDEISCIKKRISNSKDKLKFLTSKEFNNLQMMGNESQLVSNIYNVNGSLNSFSISDSKISSKVLFDFPFNLDLEKNDSDKLEEKEKNPNENDKKDINEIKRLNSSKTKFKKLDEFINELNDEKNKPDSNNNSPNGEQNNSDENKSPLIDKQNEEKILNQMQMSNINLSLKEFEENENEDNNAFNTENANNFDNRNLTGSIIFINSNIDKNIHIQNGLENYSINMDGNSITDNFNIIEGENLSPNNDKEFIEKLEKIKNNINENQNKENIYKKNNIYEKEEEIENEMENELDDEEKFFKPLNKYENKFNLDRINPF